MGGVFWGGETLAAVFDDDLQFVVVERQDAILSYGMLAVRGLAREGQGD